MLDPSTVGISRAVSFDFGHVRSGHLLISRFGSRSPSMPAVSVRCPHCSHSYSVDDSVVGRKGTLQELRRWPFQLTRSGGRSPAQLLQFK